MTPPGSRLFLFHFWCHLAQAHIPTRVGKHEACGSRAGARRQESLRAVHYGRPLVPPRRHSQHLDPLTALTAPTRRH